MVHKKHKSKRTTSKMGAKIHKKASDKHRKERKEARLHPKSNRSKKDPGIPSLWPFKESLLQQVEERQLRTEDERDRQQDARQSLQDKNRNLAELAAKAEQRAQEFDNSDDDSEAEMEQDLAVTGGKDNSRKAYFKEFKKVLTEADVILEVLDARDPIGCRTTHIERMVMDSGIQKRIILVLNKVDLVPRDVADKWIKYLRREYPTIGFKSSTQKQRTNIGQSSIHIKKADSDLLGGAETVGADSLIKLLKNYSRSSNLKTSLTVGVIGYPNVGKSSLINSLRRAKVCGVGSTPGFTKVAQEVHLDSNLKLLDCPGIVFDLPSNSKRLDYGDVLLRNCIKVELLSDPIAPVQHLLTKCKPQTMMNHYDLSPFSDVTGFLIELARARGKIRKGGLPDLEGAARLVLNDWNTGKIAYYTLPPTESKQEVAQNTAIVDGWSREFNLSEYDQAQVLDNAPTSIGKKALVLNPSLDASNADSEFLNKMEQNENSMDCDDEQTIYVKEKVTVAPSKITKTTAIFTQQELSLNPQANQNTKKALKKKQKALKKQQKDSAFGMDLELAAMGLDGGQMEDEDDEDDYDFDALKDQNKGSFMMNLASKVLGKSVPQDDDDDEDL